jgi:hypothetical protein
MRSHLRFRFLPMLMLLVLTGLGATAAFASSPSDQGPFPLSSVRDCLTTAPPTKAKICKVRPAVSTIANWQAGTSDWIVVRAAIGEDDQAKCSADQASIVPTITIDGKSFPVDTIPCAFNADTQLWFVDYRALSKPLDVGDHAIVESWFFTTDANGVPAGTTITFGPKTLTVAKK